VGSGLKKTQFSFFLDFRGAGGGREGEVEKNATDEGGRKPASGGNKAVCVISSALKDFA